MANPDALRPNYVSFDLEAPVSLLLAGPSGQFFSIASLVSMPTGVRLKMSNAPQKMELTAEGQDLAAAFKRLVLDITSRGLTLRVCGNCAAFRFSYMSYQISGGERGYCAIKGIANTGTPNDVVTLLDRCDAFQQGDPGRSWFDDDD